ncbi:hypothetical protein BJX70DRAFT_381931 [Aspergillus crustosus]
MMQSHYGPCLFKCTYLFCTYSRRGFCDETGARRPYRKPRAALQMPSVSNCIYYTVGFNAQRRCNEHLAQFHSSEV